MHVMREERSDIELRVMAAKAAAPDMHRTGAAGLRMRIVVLVASLALAGCAAEGVAKPQPAPIKSDVRAEIVAASVHGYEING